MNNTTKFFVFVMLTDEEYKSSFFRLKVSDPQILAESSAAGTVIAVRKVTTSASTNAKARALFRRWKQV